MYDCPVRYAPLTYKFTGKERDSESGLDNFPARYFTSNMGRWMMPDISSITPSGDFAISANTCGATLAWEEKLQGKHHLHADGSG